ncbi:MAG: type II toxin-antitoxin system RelB/DinJ family antitoxin [Coriobacteriales bacterium]
MGATVQMNTRISADLKARGDAVLAHAGVSASQAVRQLWEFMATYGELPALELRGAAARSGERPAPGISEEVAQGAGMAARFLRERGVSAPLPTGTAADALQDELYAAKLAEYEALYE